jgi:ATP-binding cassette subfamily B protein
MDQGRIVEEGTHQSLVARSGLYARLAELQFTDDQREIGKAAIAAIS